jgi:hypothetical protein
VHGFRGVGFPRLLPRLQYCSFRPRIKRTQGQIGLPRGNRRGRECSSCDAMDARDEVQHQSERSVIVGKLEIRVPNPTFYVFSPFRRSVERTRYTATYFSYSLVRLRFFLLSRARLTDGCGSGSRSGHLVQPPLNSNCETRAWQPGSSISSALSYLRICECLRSLSPSNPEQANRLPLSQGYMRSANGCEPQALRITFRSDLTRLRPPTDVPSTAQLRANTTGTRG